MGQCTNFINNWHSLSDVISFACTLQKKKKKKAFLLVISAVIWTIWRTRNDLCFNNKIVHSVKNTIVLIVSLVLYWTGSDSEETQALIKEWMLLDLDAIPLHIVHTEDQMLLEWVVDEHD